MTVNVIGLGMDVKVHYKGTLPDTGEVFDTSEGRDPLKFTVGKGQMIPGFEEELIGAEIGKKRPLRYRLIELMVIVMRKQYCRYLEPNLHHWKNRRHWKLGFS